jgi:hypothetical protein
VRVRQCQHSDLISSDLINSNLINSDLIKGTTMNVKASRSRMSLMSAVLSMAATCFALVSHVSAQPKLDGPAPAFTLVGMDGKQHSLSDCKDSIPYGCSVKY